MVHSNLQASLGRTFRSTNMREYNPWHIYCINTNGGKPYRSGKNDSWQEIHCLHAAGAQLRVLFWDNTHPSLPPFLPLHLFLPPSLSHQWIFVKRNPLLSFIFTILLILYCLSLSPVEMEINGKRPFSEHTWVHYSRWRGCMRWLPLGGWVVSVIYHSEMSPNQIMCSAPDMLV